MWSAGVAAYDAEKSKAIQGEEGAILIKNAVQWAQNRIMSLGRDISEVQ